MRISDWSSDVCSSDLLPNPAHISTARDIAILSMAMIDHFPVYYRYFSQQIYTYGAKTLNNHNKLLGKITGVDGIKTGYTAAALEQLRDETVADHFLPLDRRRRRRDRSNVVGGKSASVRVDLGGRR